MDEIKQDENSTRRMKVRLIGVIISYVAEFILGVVMHVFKLAPEDWESSRPILGVIIFGAHGIIGLSLIVGATFILIFSLRSHNPAWKKMGAYGFISTILSFAGGIVVVSLKEPISNIGMLFMTLGFLAAFIAYGRYYYLLKNQYE